VLAYKFFWYIFLTTFSTNSKLAWNSAFCDTFFICSKKIFLGHISTHQRFCILHFQKKSNSVYPNDYCMYLRRLRGEWGLWWEDWHESSWLPSGIKMCDNKYILQLVLNLLNMYVPFTGWVAVLGAQARCVLAEIFNQIYKKNPCHNIISIR
jgi:hypothetical protein